MIILFLKTQLRTEDAPYQQVTHRYPTEWRVSITPRIQTHWESGDDEWNNPPDDEIKSKQI